MSKADQLTVNAIRILSAEAIQKAKSGHPGLPLGAAAMAYALWSREHKHNPKNPDWINRDRFVLSAGHGSMLLYSLLHLFGYGVTIDDIKDFRQWGSKTPGHPEYGHTAGVETTTGPLGQGVAMAVGMAMAEAHLAAQFNKPGYDVVDHYTYALAGDGCMMEGVASEACSMAGTLRLGKLIVLYDKNDITIEGSTNITFKEDVGKRYEAYGWQVLDVEDGYDIDAVAGAVAEAKACTDKPSLIIVKTDIGYGCAAKQGKASAHGEPLGPENLAATKEFFGWPADKEFYVPKEVYDHMDKMQEKFSKYEDGWNDLFAAYCKEYPEMAEKWNAWFTGNVDASVFDEAYYAFENKKDATRSSSGTVLNRLAAKVPNFFGGSADLAPSNKTQIKGKTDFSADDYAGSNVHFGVREFAMAAMANGISLHGGIRPYVATFFVFSDYLKPAYRLSALMGLPVIYVLTHDSIGVGEDGPTHQPVEQLAAMRSIPNSVVFRPADSKETAAAYQYALTEAKGPVCMVLTRQGLPLYDETGKDAMKGGYILADSDKAVPDAILISSGSEVELAYNAKAALKDKGIDARVVSMPSMEVFDSQSDEYREKVLPSAVRKRVAVEAGTSFGWQKYSGLDGAVVSIDHYGASAPAGVLFKEFGFTVENVVETVMKLF
ncbi:MAG: transketolase [Christensenellales bacterium]|jgi:transketolase